MVIIVGIRVLHDQVVVMQGLVIGVGVGGKNVKTFFRFDVECGGVSIFRGPILLCCLLLPLKDASPVLSFFLVKFVFPLGFRLFAIGPDVTTLVATGAVSSLDIVVQLPLSFGSDFISIDNRVQVGSFQTAGSLAGCSWSGRRARWGLVEPVVLVSLVLALGLCGCF